MKNSTNISPIVPIIEHKTRLSLIKAGGEKIVNKMIATRTIIIIMPKALQNQFSLHIPKYSERTINIGIPM